MKVVASIIARLRSKRLSYKNLLAFGQHSLLSLGIEKLKTCPSVDCIVVSTESELIARVAKSCGGVEVLKRPDALAGDGVPSIPVFEHIVDHYPCDMHVNFNINFPLCDPAVVERAIELCWKQGEVLSDPYAVWAQRSDVLKNYGDPWDITASCFSDERAGQIDVHTEEELLEVHRILQNGESPWSNESALAPS